MNQRGFTLIETLVVMVVLGIAAATIVALQGGIFARQSSNQDLQVGAQIVQECAEQVLALRRRTPSGGYAAVTPAACSALGNVGGFGVPLVTLRDDADANLAACASTYCTASITVGKGASVIAPITLRLRRY